MKAAEHRLNKLFEKNLYKLLTILGLQIILSLKNEKGYQDPHHQPL